MCTPPGRWKGPRTGAFVANYTLDEEQEKTLERFRSHLFEGDEAVAEDVRWICDDACLVRFLRARDWDLKKSEVLLREMLVWRNEFGVDRLHPDTLDKEAETGKLYRHGFDLHGRPVLYMRPRFQNTKDYRNQVNLTVYTLERIVQSMDQSKGVEQLTLLIDFKDYSLFNAPPMWQSKEVLHIITSCYPERLGLALLVDAPWIFKTFFKVISPLIPAVTKQKIHFISGSTEPGSSKVTKLSEHLDMSAMQKDYGGTGEWEYDHSVYWAFEQSEANQ